MLSVFIDIKYLSWALLEYRCLLLNLIRIIFCLPRFCLFSIAIDVHVNRCLDNIVAGGVQICGLHATVAPRRQQQQSPPVLEEFVFVPYVETKCLTANGKLAEKLKLCKGTTVIPSVVLIVLSVFMLLIFQPSSILFIF